MLSLLSLLNRRLHDIAILMYEVKSGPAPSIVEELFKQKILVIHLEIKQ